MDGGQVGIFKEGHKVSLSGLLKSHDGRGLETEIGLQQVGITMSDEMRIRMTRDTDLEVLGNLTNQTLEWELADKQLGRLLVPPNFTEGDGTGPEPVRLLHTTSGSL